MFYESSNHLKYEWYHMRTVHHTFIIKMIKYVEQLSKLFVDNIYIMRS